MTPPAPAGPGRWPTLVLLFATAVGVPGSLIAVFKAEALQHPGLTLLCVLLWELLLLIAGLVTDVWSKLRSRWVDRITDWVDHSLQALFSRYRRSYLDWLFYRHRDFDVKGLTTQGIYNLELEQVFVDLTIQPPPPGGNPADPIRPFPKELTGRRSIWDYLTNESFTDHLALIGAPGSGKTTLLKKIALQMTGRKRPKIRQSLPILLFLREHAEAILGAPPPSLADVANADLIRKQCQNPPPAVWFRNKLEAGRCLVLFDGLDEVASQEVRQKVVAWVETQMTAFPKNRFLISSRPHGYRTCPVAGVSVLEIQPFNRDQVRQFVHNWYHANEIHASGKLDPGVEMKAREGAEDLLRRLGNSQTLTDLAVNPLLLTMIATVHRFRSSLPGRRVELYAEICEVFLGKRQQARGVEDTLTPVQKQRVLQPLAYQLMSTKKREISIEEAVSVISEVLRRVAGEKPGTPEADFLKNIENGSGLLLERESGIYSFAHLAFQEYLTAVHIRENHLTEELVGNVHDPWWHEVIRLYGAQGDASGILAVCLSSRTPTVPELSLAIDCLEGAREVDVEWRAKIDSLIKEGAESPDLDRFHLAAETMLARRLRDMVPVDERTFVDPDYLSHAEYQLFLDEERMRDYFHQPDHWQGFRFLEGQALTPVVGMRYSDAVSFCEWLSARDSIFSFRLPSLREAEHFQLPTTQEASGTAAGFWMIDGFLMSGHSLDFPLAYLKSLVERDFSEGEFARDLYLDLESNRDLTRDLARTLELALNRDPACFSTYNYDYLDRDLTRDLARAFSQDRLRDSNRSRNHERKLHDRTPDLDGAHFRALDSDRTRNLVDRARNLALNLEGFSTLAIDQTLTPVLGIALNRDLEYDLVHNLDPAHDLASNLARDLARDLSLARAHAHKPARVNPKKHAIESSKLNRNLRRLWRVWSLLLATLPDPQPRTKFRGLLRSRATSHRPDLWIYLYKELVLLEARIDGVVSAIEGIRIVKERRS
jgi:hypothetical protein